MRDVTYLTKRDGVYYVRLDVPEDLVPVLKTTTRKKSLKTKDKAEAKSRMWAVITEWQREFDDLRSRRVLTDADRQHAVWDHYTGTLARDEAERANLPTDADIQEARAKALARIHAEDVSGLSPLAVFDVGLDVLVAQGTAEVSSNHRKIKLAELRRHLAKGETALIAHEVDAYIEKNHLLVQRGTPDWGSV